MLRVRGDEFFHWLEDLAGYTVVRSKGNFVYARMGDTDSLTATESLVGRVDPKALGLVPGLLPSLEKRNLVRFQALGIKLISDDFTPVPAKGTVKNLVILCRFKDHTLKEHTRP